MKARFEFKHDEEYNEYLKIYFAAMAMKGLISNPSIIDQWNCQDVICSESVKYADALIAELNKEK